MRVDRSFKAGLVGRKDERSISRQTLNHGKDLYPDNAEPRNEEYSTGTEVALSWS
jgi:hypothetical protein